MKSLLKFPVSILKAFFQGFSLWVKSHKKNFRITHGLILALFLGQMLIGSRIGATPLGAYQVFHEGQGARQGAYVEQASPEQTSLRIGRFTQSLVKTGFDWKPSLAVTEEGLAYPLNFHSASFYFDMGSGLRQKWLLSRASKYQKSAFPFDKFLNGDFISTVEMSGNPQVTQLSDTRWESEVRAVRVVVAVNSPSKAAYKERLSFRFVVSEVPPRKGIEWGMEGKALNQVLNKIPTDGLQIIDYKEIS